MILSGSAAIVAGAAGPARATIDSAAFAGGCCGSHLVGLSGRNLNAADRQGSGVSVINRLQVNNISSSGSDAIQGQRAAQGQRMDDGRFGVSSSAAAAGGGGGGGGDDAPGAPANTDDPNDPADTDAPKAPTNTDDLNDPPNTQVGAS